MLLGCGGEPWSVVDALPYSALLAVMAGLVLVGLRLGTPAA